MCAGFFLAAIWSRSWRLPITGVVLLVVTAVVVGGIYPALIQSLKVTPSAKSLEAKYIERNINATRAAFGLDRVKRIQNPTPAETENKAVLRAAANDIPGVRIIDPNVVAPTFRQLQAQRDYYAFPDTLDVDRYTIDKQTRDAVVAVREINLEGLPDGQRNWLNDHTVYTHGYGFYAAYGNQRTTEGDPVFFEGGGLSAIGEYEPRMYFGELSPAYSVVGAEKGAPPREFDFPAGGEGDVAVQNTYAGNGGVPIGSTLRRLAYAIKYREANFLLSDAVNGDSRILDHRSPTERVERVAPWLRLDGNVYPAVVEGRVQWIVDGFTTSANYPNSRLIELAEATSDSVAQRSNVVTVGAGQVNYVRNAVKATVDAYTGDGEALRLGHQGPDAQGVEQRVPRLGAAALRDLRRPDGPHPLPAGPAQGAARAAHRVPRHQPRRLLLGLGQVARPARPVVDRPGPAAGVPVDRDAG